MRVLVVLLTLLAGLLAIPATTLAAGSCSLDTSISPGHVITVTGAGFDPNADVAVTQTWSGSNATAGGNTGPQTTTSKVMSDASGGFAFTIDAGPGHGGSYAIEASTGTCTVATTVVAVETAGGINRGTTGGAATGTGATPPPTDTAPVADGPAAPPAGPVIAILVGAALLALAFVLRRDRETRKPR